jgi:hypothetical protein
MPTSPYQNIRFNPTMSTANNGVSVIFNSTQGFGPVPSSTAVGDMRGRFLNWRLIWSELLTAQNTTMSARKLANGAWVAVTTADFPLTLASGDATITANAAPQATCSWLVPWDFLLYETNGAPGPTVHSIEAYLTNNPNPGV